MTPLRQRMIDDMQLRGLSARTQETYVTAVRQLSKHYRRSPDRISEEELRQYFLYLANEKKVARATATITLCAVRFLYEQTLHRPWTTLRFVRPQREVVERERESFYALPAAAFAARVRHYARWCFGIFPAFIEQVRSPTAPVSWPRRAGFALRLALEFAFMFGYLALVRPGQLRSRRAAELGARSGEG